MAFKELCTGKEGHMGTWGGKDSSWTGLSMDFMLPFFIEFSFGVCFCCIRQHINAQMIYLYFLFLLMLVSLRLASRLHIQNVNPEPTHLLSPFFFCFCCCYPPHPLHSLSATRVPKEQTHRKKGVFGVCNKQYVCV